MTPGNRRGEEMVLFVSKIAVIKTVWYWHKDRHIDQWNRRESSEINPCIYDQLIFDKDSKNTQWERIVSLTNGVWETGHPHAKL